MITLRKMMLFLCLTASPLISAQEGNVLIYTDLVQVTSEISPYETIQENAPITGTLMVTHNDNLKVDVASIRMGNDPLKVKFVKNVTLSASDKLSISIYEFELAGKKKGNYTLDPISVSVGGKKVQAPPLIINVGE